MSNFINRHHVLATVLVTAVAGAALSGCAAQGGLEEKTGSFLVTPGKYVLYSCPQLAVRQDGVMTRKRELDALIAKAGSGIASTLAYRGEYAQVQDDLAELAKENAAKNCPPPKPAAVPSPPKPKKGKPARG